MKKGQYTKQYNNNMWVTTDKTPMFLIFCAISAGFFNEQVQSKKILLLSLEALQVWLPCHVCVMRWQRAERLGLCPVFWLVDIWMIDSLTLDQVPTKGGWVLPEACHVRTP